MPFLVCEVTDVSDRWIGDLPFDNSYVSVKIADAEDVIRAYEPNVDDMDLPLARWVRVVANMVIRHLKNPDGVRQEQETTDVASASRTYSGADPGSIQLTEDDKKTLFGRSRGAYSISMEAPDVGAVQRLPRFEYGE